MYYKGAKGAILVFDITSKTSFENIDKWLNELKKTSDENIQLILIGNKCDLNDNRVISQDDAEVKCKDLNIPYMETSALNSFNVDKAFNYLIEQIASKIEKNIDDDIEFDDANFGNNINLNVTDDKNEKKKCCGK